MCNINCCLRFKKFLSLLFILALSPIKLEAFPSNWVISAGSQFSFLLNLPVPAPRLLTQGNTTRALALDATTFLAEPFSLTQVISSGPDPRTRLLLVVTDIDPIVGPNPYNISADAEDEAHRIFPLAVEYVAKLPIDSNYAVHIRLNDEMSASGDVLVRLYYDGVASNRVRVGLGRVGGGPPDDIDPNPSPSPSASPTPTPTPLPSPSPSASPTPTPLPSPSPSASPTPSPTPNLITYPTAIRNLSLTPAKTAYYRFTETSGTSIADSSGGSHTGTRTGAVTLNQTSLLTGDSNPSAFFVGGKVTSGNFMPTLTTGITLSCLVKIAAFPSVNFGYSLISAGTNGASGLFELYHQGSENVFAYAFTDTAGGDQVFQFPTLTGTRTSGRIYHVAVTHDFSSKTVKFYLDGLCVGQSTYTADVRSSASQPVSVGNDNVNSYIDEALAVGDRVLTEGEIRSLARASVGADQSATSFYVSPTGSYRASGLIGDPVDLYTAFRSGLATAGNTYYLRAGTHYAPALTNGDPTEGFLVYAHGTAGNPIRYKEYPGERVFIDAARMALGPTNYEGTRSEANITFLPPAHDVELWDFEVMNSTSDAVNNRARWRPQGFVIAAPNITLIGLWVYDNFTGIFAGTAATNFETHGSLIFNNGTYFATGPEINPECNCEPAGPGMYIENSDLTNGKLVKNSVSWGNAGAGYQIFGTGAQASGITMDGDVAYMSKPWSSATGVGIGFTVVAQTTMRQDSIINSVAYTKTGSGGGNYAIGRPGDPHQYLTFRNNKSFGNGVVSILDFNHVTFSNNLFIDTRPSAEGANNWYMTYMRPANYSDLPPTDPAYDCCHAYGYLGQKGYWTGTGNTYAGMGYSSSQKIWNEDGVGDYTLATWQSLTNIDSDVTIRNTATSPYTSPLVYYFPNLYEPGAGFISVYNPPQSAAASVNLASFGLVNGQAYEIRDAMNPFVVLQSSTYNAASPIITVPMTGTIVTTPLGYTVLGSASNRTSREFKTFIVIGR